MANKVQRRGRSASPHGNARADSRAEDNGHASGLKKRNPNDKAGRHAGGKHGSKSDPDLGNGEFGGPVGVVFIMLVSHIVIFYLYVAQHFNDGALFASLSPGQRDRAVASLVPTYKAWAMYLAFLAFELVLAYTMPGVVVQGFPVPSEGNIRHTYHCNGLASWYVTLATVGAMHYTGVFRLRELADDVGAVMSVAVIMGNLVAVLIYVRAPRRPPLIRRTDSDGVVRQANAHERQPRVRLFHGRHSQPARGQGSFSPRGRASC